MNRQIFLHSASTAPCGTPIEWLRQHLPDKMDYQSALN